MYRQGETAAARRAKSKTQERAFASRASRDEARAQAPAEHPRPGARERGQRRLCEVAMDDDDHVKAVHEFDSKPDEGKMLRYTNTTKVEARYDKALRLYAIGYIAVYTAAVKP